MAQGAPNVSIPIGDQDVVNNQDPDAIPQSLTQVRHDLQTLSFAVQKLLGVTRFSGWCRCSVPVAGAVRVYASTDTATAGSTGVNYHIFNCTRQGQAEQAYQVDTRQGELAAYTECFLGEFSCGQGDVLASKVKVTGAPALTLSQTNFSLRCELKPT